MVRYDRSIVWQAFAQGLLDCLIGIVSFAEADGVSSASIVRQVGNLLSVISNRPVVLRFDTI